MNESRGWRMKRDDGWARFTSFDPPPPAVENTGKRPVSKSFESLLNKRMKTSSSPTSSSTKIFIGINEITSIKTECHKNWLET